VAAILSIRIIGAFGFCGLTAETKFERIGCVSPHHFEPLLTRDQVAKRVVELGQKIAIDFPATPSAAPLWLIGALKGAVFFQADLARAIDRDVSLGFIRASSYGSGTTSSQDVQIRLDLDDDIAGADVILVEDIVDTGYTARALLDRLAAANPRTLRLVSLLDKPSRRKLPVTIDYRGFEIPDKFVVGYGLDHAESYRNRPDISVLTL
jgi:hypoxanthine phosphoribosyltransferase